MTVRCLVTPDTLLKIEFADNTVTLQQHRKTGLWSHGLLMSLAHCTGNGVYFRPTIPTDVNMVSFVTASCVKFLM